MITNYERFNLKSYNILYYLCNILILFKKVLKSFST